MANNDITNDNKRGIGDIYQSSTAYNANNQQIQKDLQKINTVFLARITAVNGGGTGGSKTVSATPLICQIDANGNKLTSPVLVEVPYYRVQAGTGALILDPVIGDIGVFVCAKRDISNIKNGVSDPQVPASFRSFDLADSIMIATIHTGVASTYIHISPDGQTIEINAPNSLTVNTATATITASKTTVNGDVEINGNLDVKGGMNSTGDLNCGGISFLNHVHSGVEVGSGDTDKPK